MIIAQVTIAGIDIFALIVAVFGGLGTLLLIPADAAAIGSAVLGVPFAVFTLLSDTALAAGAVVLVAALLWPLLSIAA
jgi:hypothetical protein